MANANNPLGLKIEQFGGTEGENPKEWLDKFDVFSSFQGWKEEKKASAFRLLLTGVSDLWCKQLDDTTKANYDTVTTKFLQKFARKTPTWIDVEGLMSQKGVRRKCRCYKMPLTTFSPIEGSSMFSWIIFSGTFS